jgi:hypothetical protein
MIFFRILLIFIYTALSYAGPMHGWWSSSDSSVTSVESPTAWANAPTVQLLRGRKILRRLQSTYYVAYAMPGFVMTMKVGSSGLDLLIFTKAMMLATETHLAHVITNSSVSSLPANGPFSVSNFYEFLLAPAIGAQPFDASDVLVQLNFTGGVIFTNATVPANSSLVLNTIFDTIKAAFLTTDGYNGLVVLLQNNTELQRIKGVKIAVNPYFDPIPPLPPSLAGAPPTPAPARKPLPAAPNSIGPATVIAIVVICVLILIGALVVWYYCRQRRAEEKRLKAIELARKRSERARRKLGSSAGGGGGSSKSSGLSNNSADSSASSELSLDEGGNSKSKISSTRIKGKKTIRPPLVPSVVAKKTFARPALESRRTLSLMAIT